MYEMFDHTADMGLRVRSESLSDLFADAGRALCAALVDNPDAIRPLREVSIELHADALDYLLFDWLSELLYRYETDRLLLFDFDVALHGTQLVGRARGEVADPARHQLSHEVKAITYHGLKVEPCDGGWEAELIVDI